tara:strand:- start:28766 stop:30646 length:1881 start_codon:yes stop_codon:yes gene_type:complete
MKSLKEIIKQMKTLNKILIAFSLLVAMSCEPESILKEESISNQTAGDYFSTPSGFEDLSKSIYPLLRPIAQLRALTLNGTDIFSRSGGFRNVGTEPNVNIDVYGPEFTSGVSEVEDFWVYHYKALNRANTVISRSDKVENTGSYANTLSIRVAEAKFIRSYCLFSLVQQFGDIPMPLEETTGASKEVIRVPSAEVYSQIITDLTEAEAALPPAASDYGRANKGAAQHLLARVYLTRGWNFQNALGGTPADFTSAREYADKVIAAHPMVDNYKDIFPKKNEDVTNQSHEPGNQNYKNTETIFSVQYSNSPLTSVGEDSYSAGGEGISSDWGNNAHSIFGGSHDECPGSPGRTSDYNRQLGIHTTVPGVWRLFDPETDTRYHLNFVEKVYAVVDNPGFVPADGVAAIDIKKGDVVVEYRDWNNPATTLAERGKDVGGNMDYAVINVDQLGKIDESNYHNNSKHPMMWKFWEPGIDYGNGFGEFDQPLMRSSEAYLIAAEAIVKGASNGSIGSASDYYNAVVDRAVGGSGADADMAADPNDLSSTAAKSYRASGSVTIEMIMDERAREFMGEGLRWYDLKRTATLISRSKAFNPWIGALNYIEEYHYLRPIPLSEIDLATNDVSQNPGY